MRLTLILALIATVQMSGGATAAPRSDSNSGAVFRSGFESTITHIGVNAVSSAVFAVANHNISVALAEDFPSVKVEAFFVPQPQGYDVVILSHRRLSREEEATVTHIIYAAFDDARNNRPIYERKKG